MSDGARNCCVYHIHHAVDVTEVMSAARRGLKQSPETIAKRLATCAARRAAKLAPPAFAIAAE